ncbi:bromodomain adjacent to zinc finger domain protein 2B [Lates calcarifer]|uniref:Bromodomain adjacent to zinc finger domain protein 2B n=1 Tax=Lates calcarifer TaxID=8187 RepID=A0AAJ7LP60_LATCA|nr:bromodomain adjacent to zinc finger domain protein 2B [Lates calcarifer]
MSGSQSGSLSDSSSDGEESSSDPDDMEEEEEEEDNDEDEDDQSNDSEDSDSGKESQFKRKVKRLTQNTTESKKRRPRTTDGNTTQDSHCDSVPLTSSYCLQSHSAVRAQSTALFLQSSRTAGGGSEVQDAPLALITKPRSQSSTPNSTPNSKLLLAATTPPYPMPINLSTGHQGTIRQLYLVRGSESDIHSSKELDSDSLGEDYDDDDDDEDDEDDINDEDSGSSLSGEIKQPIR